MENSDHKHSRSISEQKTSAEEVASLSKNSKIDGGFFTEFSLLLDKFTPILSDIKDNEKLMHRPPAQKAVESIEKELSRAKDITKGVCKRSPVKQIEILTQELGRSLGLVLFACIDAPTEIKLKIAALHKELMHVKFDSSLTPSPSSLSPSPCANHGPKPSKESGFSSEQDSFINEIEEEKMGLTADDVVLQLKYGNNEEFRLALLALTDVIRDGGIDKEWIHDEDIIPILFNRLGSSRPINRLTIIQILRILASEKDEIKEKMADAVYLSLLVKSLTRDAGEGREAVGLLSQLSDISGVRRRIGRIQGCIVVLVTVLNGDDPTVSQYAAKLLIALSSNTQNVLYMAEAGLL